jgi:hypothetical protein
MAASVGFIIGANIEKSFFLNKFIHAVASAWNEHTPRSGDMHDAAALGGSVNA